MGKNNSLFLTSLFSRTASGKRPVGEGETGDLIPYIVLAICIGLFILVAIILAALCYKKKLPEACYNWKGGKKFQPVNVAVEVEEAEVRT